MPHWTNSKADLSFHAPACLSVMKVGEDLRDDDRDAPVRLSHRAFAAIFAMHALAKERAHQKRHPAFSTRPARHWLYSNDASDDQFFS